MVTASHNPAKDNGYKVYLGAGSGLDYRGSQIVPPVDARIAALMAEIGSVMSIPRGGEWLTLDDAVMQSYITRALEFSKRPDIHIWMNRFPPQHLEGYEHLIQDPYKLNDEVRGRREEYARLLDDGTPVAVWPVTACGACDRCAAREPQQDWSQLH